MKKIFTLLAVALFAFTAQSQEGYTYQVKTLTFEDKDYPQNAPNYLGKTSWSSLIDTPQYGGELLYGENHGDTSKVVAVRVPVSNNVSTKKISSANYKAEKATDGIKTFTVENDVFSADLSVVGDVPDGVTVEYDGDKVLNANETECLTIKGLPDNTIIREIVVESLMREIIGVDMEVDAFYDGENIAKLKLVGWGSGFEDDSDVVIINQSSEEHEMIMLDDSRKPHSGELIFKQSSVNGHSDQMFVTSYKVSYELVTSTGITEINSSTNAVEVSRFTADGKRISAPQKGINIIHMSDGSTRKVVVK